MTMVLDKQGRDRSFHGTLCGSVSRLTLSASLGLLGLSVLPATSWAACSVVAPFICSGTNTAPQTISGNSAVVTTAPGFSVDTTPGGGTALLITGIGDLRYIDDNASSLTGSGGNGLELTATGDDGGTPGSITVETEGLITGDGYGILAHNLGSGSIDLTATGLVTATDGAAILAFNEAIADQITVNAGATSGGTYGILVVNNGTGASSVTATGDAIGTGFAGISVINGVVPFASATGTGELVPTGPGGTDISIIARGASGAVSGIYTNNWGSGSTGIFAGGVVEGGFNGIVAYNQETAVNLIIAASGVNVTGAGGGLAGIYAENNGTGLTSVVTVGAVTAANAPAGIVGYNGAAATSLSIGATSVIGSAQGIVAINGGSGATVVMATGNVSAEGVGIIVTNGQVASSEIFDLFPDIDAPGGTDLTVTAATASGGLAGILVTNNGSGATEVTATGLVQGGLAGIVASNETTATDLTINAASTAVTDASGAEAGAIYAYNEGTGATRVIATGDANGALGIAGILAFNDVTTTSLTVEATSASGGFHGILAVNSGSGANSVTATGNIVGGFAGIVAVNGEIDGSLLDPFIDVDGPGGTDLTVNAVNVSGGYVGILATNYGSGATEVTTTGLVQAGVGGVVVSNEITATDLTIRAAAVTMLDAGGGIAGVYASNEGTGATRVIVTGNVDARTAIAGILAASDSTATSLRVEAASVIGAAQGIVAANSGSGATSVTATGDVVGGFIGINAINGQIDGSIIEPFFEVDGPGGTDLTVNATTVTGGLVGIYVTNYGSGSTEVTATGLVQGGAGGIVVMNEITATDLTIKSGAVAILDSGDSGIAGIYATNQGMGATAITATGPVSAATALTGVLAINAPTTTSLKVETASVVGGYIGILAANAGSGATSVIATGDVDGGLSAGIVAVNGVLDLDDVFAGDFYPTAPGGTDLTVSAAGVTGAGYGINAINTGTGATRVSATGNVSGGTGYGILAINSFAATDMSVNVASVFGETAGILAQNDGSGLTSVISSGPVTSAGGTGIDVFGGSTTTSMTIAANGAIGAEYGIDARHFGTGPLSIFTTGLIQGGLAAITASSGGSAIAIVNDGTVQNLSLSSADLAVEATGGAVNFANNGSLFGTVLFGADGGSLTNAGIWNSAGGTSDFGGGANQLVNGPGAVIFAAADGSVAETAAFNNVTSFRNRGTFTMMDGGAGDRATVSGSASFEAGSTYAVDINASGQSDLFSIGGMATLMAGSTLTVNIEDGLRYGARYTVLTADGGLTGAFGTFDGASTAFLTIDDFYDTNNVYLDVLQYRSFTAAALTPNQLATAGGLQSLPTDNALFAAIASLPTDAQAQAAFDSLSGEIGASAKGVLLTDSAFLRGAVFDRLTSANSSTPAGGMSVAPLGYAAPAKSSVPYPTKAEPVMVVAPESAIWAQGFGSWGNSDGNGNAASIDRDTGGFFMGMDTLVANAWRLGVLGGYSHTSFDVGARASSGESDNYHLGVYAGTNWGAVNFRAGAAYTWNDISTSRNVDIPTSQLLQANYDAGTAQAFGELGYGLTFGAVDFEPFIGLAYVNLGTDGFSESGGVAALTSSSDSTDATYTSLGLRAATEFQLGAVAATAKGVLGWRHAFGDITPTSAYQFASGSSPFTVGGVPIAEDTALIEAGLDLHFMPMATFGIAYGGQFGDGATDQSFTANLNVRF